MRKDSGSELRVGVTSGAATQVCLPAGARAKHLYICGGTGAGKSKFLEHLARQDILNWRDSHCGMLLIDPHGAVYDGLMSWLAAHKLKRPIIPIDLRRDDWVVSYNLLRQRRANPSVVIDTLVDAIAYVWGQSGTNQTPLLARWAGNTLSALYEKRLTLAETIHLTDREAVHIRRALTSNLSDDVSNRDWGYANELPPKLFDEQISSTLNRLTRFVRNKYLRAIFGQTEHSLDLGEAMEKGHIILVSLARKNALISDENARLFATLLLNDLWTAAQERRDKSGNPKPFYVYLDEFQRFISPTIAENLAEARGYGLHLTMAHQFPRQLLNQGEHGQRLFDEVMENASTKVVFRLSYEENLKPLAQQLFMGTFDPDEIKHQLQSTKVMGYREENREIVTQSSTRGRGRTSTSTTSTQRGEGEAEGFNPNFKRPPILSDRLGPNDPLSRLASWNSAFSQADSDGESESESEGESRANVPVFVAEFGKELSSVQFRSLEEQLFRAMAKLFSQQDRHFAVRIVGRHAPIFVKTPEVKQATHNQRIVEKYVTQHFQKWPFFLPLAKAKQLVADRDKKLIQEIIRPSSETEAVTARRPIPTHRVHKPG